jgi:hypothetical protein
MPFHCNDTCRWHYKIEECISDAIGGCYPREWNEDHISYTWLKEFRNNFKRIHISGYSDFQVCWDAFKADGQLEENYGDIAFLVRISFKNNKTLEGVAFMEAKRIYDNDAYTALKWPQLVRQSLGLSNHRVILYDYKRSHLRSFLPIGLACECCCPYGERLFHMGTRAYSVTTQHVLALRERNRDLHEISYPLSSQIFSRYFWGQDLDYSTDIVNAVKIGVMGGIKFLVVAHVSFGSERELSIDGILGENHGYEPLQ